MSNLTELLAELAQIAPDVCKPNEIGKGDIKISDYPFSQSSRPGVFYVYVDNKPIEGQAAEALLVDALTAECRRRGWPWSIEWKPALEHYIVDVNGSAGILVGLNMANVFIAAFITAYKSKSSAA